MGGELRRDEEISYDNTPSELKEELFMSIESERDNSADAADTTPFSLLPPEALGISSKHAEPKE